jgi:general stress protein 26
MTMHILLGIFLTLSACVVGIAYAAGDLGDSVKTALSTQKLISVATQRANGEWGRAAPIWFMYDGEAAYFITAPKSYKARRIRKGSPVQVWLDEKIEPAFIGETQIVTDTAVLDRINAAYKRKYWAAWFTYWAMPLAGRVEAGKMVAVRVAPTIESP